ncbi:DUF6773 family protein [Paenibacillus wynnii]|uniref:DUF3278 domain-containing protein n=1 Tax=Paenibacillus wynnii TaxID=268407 RepID=A0A098M382_9BACL|nr:DUF6773 family protein [Paenibacillus wynnii]KGE16960.1 hypothetical protein PWYN_20015 [Paenibacillus wynnii]
MRGKGIKDERITASIKRYEAQGFQLLSALLIASLVVKVFILKWDVEDYVDTMLMLVISGLYVEFRKIKDGLYLLPNKQENIKKMKKSNYIGGAVATLIWASIMFISDLTAGGDINITRIILKRLVGAIIFFIGITWSQWFILKLSNKYANKNAI